MPSVPPDLRALSVRQRELLELLAVMHETTYVEALAHWLDALHGQLGPQDVRKGPDVNAARAAAHELAERGLLAAHSGMYRIAADVMHPLLEDLHANGKLEPLAAFVRGRAPLQKPGQYWCEPGRLAREVLLAAYLEPTPDLLAMIRSSGISSRSSGSAADILLDAMGTCPSKALLTRIGIEAADMLLAKALVINMLTATPLGAGVLSYLLGTEALSDRTVALGVAQLAFEGRLDDASSLLKGRDGAEALEAAALLHLSRGQLPEARAQAMLAFARWRSKKGAFKGTNTALGPWVTLLLLTSRDPAEAQVAVRQIELAAQPRFSSEAEHLYQPLDSFAAFLAGRAWPKSSFSRILDWQEVLFVAVLSSFAGMKRSEAMTSSLELVAGQARESGVAWAASLLDDARAERPSGVLHQLYRAEAAWERALSALDRTVQELKAEPEKRDVTERLVFIVEPFPSGAFNLGARIQVRQARGYSAGRTVSWKRLLESAAEAPWIDDADRRVLSHIGVTKESSYYYSGGASYVISPLALEALIGHPRVFTNDGKNPLEVARGTPQIEVRERAGQLTIGVTPAVCAQPGSEIACVSDGPGRVLVYVLGEAQRKLVARLGDDGLRVPEEGVERAKALLGKLADHFLVSSEVGVEAAHIEEIAPDSRVHVLLFRRGSGLRVRLVVLPLGSGPSFAPGEGSGSVLGTISQGDATRQVRTTRDLAVERQELEWLLAAAPSLASAETEGRDTVISDVLSCLELVTELYRARDRVVVSWPEGEPLSVIGEVDARSLTMKLRSQNDWLSVEGELAVDASLKLSFRELLARTSQANGRFLALDDGRFLALTEQLKKRLDGMLAVTEVAGDQLLLHPLAAIDLASWTGELGSFQGDRAVQERLLLISEAQGLAPALPAGLDAELRPYQHDGFVWLSRLTHWGAGACLADDMGLGKTLQTLALVLAEAPRGPALIVAPLSVCSNWLEEMARFAPTLNARLFAGSDRERMLEELGPFDVLVTSYGLLQQDIERFEKRRFRVLVLDEAQAIKNASTLRARSAMRLVGDIRVALTGTPIENHLGELWSIMSFLNPGLLGTARSFDERFAKPIQRDGDRRAAALLRRLVRPFVLRRRKNEVLEDLPARTVITHRIAPSDAERTLFAALREQALARLRDQSKPAESRMRILAELMRLRRAACHPSLVAPEAGLESSKLAAFEELLEELREGGHRALVFSQFVDYLSLVRERLDGLGVAYQYLDGSCSLAERERAVRAFQAGHGDVFLISLKAGGFGLNLTAADYVVHLDPWWNPAVEDQASDRAHRIGQTRPVTIYRLVLEGSIEEKILGLHAHKRDLADQLLEGSSAGAPLSVDELLGLLRDAGPGASSRPKTAPQRTQDAV
jgi:superfamily II DNA or RNA helicase